MENESIFTHIKGDVDVDSTVLANLESGMKEALKGSKEKELQRKKAADIARGWLIK